MASAGPDLAATPRWMSAPRSPAAGARSARRGTRHLHHHFDGHGDAGREGPHADCGAGVPAGLAEDLDHQIRESVDDLRVVGEVVSALDHTERLDDPAHAVEASDGLPYGGEQAQARRPRRLLSLLDREIAADPTLVENAPVPHRTVTGEEEEIAG